MAYDDLDEPQVGEVMTSEPIFTDEDVDVSEAAKVMKKEDIGSLLVGDRNELRGIVTTKDVVYKYVAEEEGKNVKDIMSSDLVTISPKKAVEDAALIMVKKSIERLPVIENDKVVGLISTSDIINVHPSLYLDLLKGLKLGEESFGMDVNETEVGQCEVCDNYSEDLQEENGEMLCPECREEML